MGSDTVLLLSLFLAVVVQLQLLCHYSLLLMLLGGIIPPIEPAAAAAHLMPSTLEHPIPAKPPKAAATTNATK